MSEGRRIWYSGRVQRVGFRAGIFRIAVAVGVRGFVRNHRDGRVEVVVAADPARIERFLREVRARWADHLDGFEVEVGSFADGLERFEIR